MQYLLDTVTIIRHFSDSGAIGKKAREILDDESNSFYISVVSLMEIMYLAEKNRIKINLADTIEKINSSTSFTIIDLTSDIINIAADVDFYELHDRMILATALFLDLPILSSDERFHEIKNVKVIWN